MLRGFGCNEATWLRIEHERKESKCLHTEPEFDVATRSVVIFGDTGNAVTGHVLDGRPFVVRHDPVRGLCLTIGDTDFGTDFGCNDGAPLTLVQGTPRYSAEVQGSALAYGYLPEYATAVVAVFADGRRVDDDVVSNSTPRVWALPLPLGVEVSKAPPISYVAADGTETPAPKV